MIQYIKKTVTVTTTATTPLMSRPVTTTTADTRTYIFRGFKVENPCTFLLLALCGSLLWVGKLMGRSYVLWSVINGFIQALVIVFHPELNKECTREIDNMVVMTAIVNGFVYVTTAVAYVKQNPAVDLMFKSALELSTVANYISYVSLKDMPEMQECGPNVWAMDTDTFGVGLCGFFLVLVCGFLEMLLDDVLKRVGFERYDNKNQGNEGLA